MTYIRAALLLLFVAVNTSAATSLTLTAAVETARQNNPELKSMDLAVDQASWNEFDAISGHLPHLDISATEFLSAKYSRLGIVFNGTPIDFPSAFPQTEIDIEASWTLFDGLGTINKYRASLLEHEAAQLDYENAAFRLERNVRRKFYEALAAKDLAAVADQNIATLEQHLSLVKADERAGSGTRFDVLRIESLLEEARADRVLAYDNVAISRQDLNEAIGATDTSDSALEGTLPVPDEKRLGDGIKLDLSARADVQAQNRRELAQDRHAAESNSMWFPKISVFGTQQFYKFGDFDPVVLANATFQSAYMVGLKLTWNLFDGGASLAKRGKEHDGALRAIEASRGLDLKARNEFETWKRRFIYNSVLYRARQRSVEESQESVRLAAITVKAGVKTHSEYLDAELDLFRARAGVIQAQVDAAIALSNLEIAVGHAL